MIYLITLILTIYFAVIVTALVFEWISDLFTKSPKTTKTVEEYNKNSVFTKDELGL